jgi:hypothetical protein
VACGVFLATIACIILYQPNYTYTIGEYVHQLYFDTFSIVNNTMMYVFNYSKIGIFEPMTEARFTDSFFSAQGQMFTRFVAFIYLYHYLNWFSKTSIIKWHEVSKDRLIIITTLWFFAVALYFYDYMLGFEVLFTLSLMHVFLEFPLNFRTIHTLFDKLIGKTN